MRYPIFWVAVLFCVAATARAQGFPDRPLRIIVAFSTGTAADIVARQIALKHTKLYDLFNGKIPCRLLCYE